MIFLLRTLFSTAQIFYLELNDEVLESGSIIKMDANSDSIYTFNLVKPDTEWEYITWQIEGGLTLISKNDSSISVQCATGESYNTKYSKYSSAKIYVSASKLLDEDIPDGCEECAAYSDCNPDYSTSVYIYKTFDWSGNAIVGNDCISAGDSVTFSVAPWVSLLYVAGGDTYYWNIPDSLIDSDLYYSADGSSVTFVASENIEGQTISVEIGKYNLDSGQDPLTFMLGNDVPDPEIDGMINDAMCLPFDTETATIEITNAISSASYSWDLKTWEIYGQNENGSIISFYPEDNAQTIRLDVSGGCSNKTFIYDINRSLTEDSEIVTHNDNPYCITANTYQEFYIENVPTGTEMTWSVEGDGWEITEAESIKARPYISVGTSVGIVTTYCTKCDSPVIIDTFYIAPNEIGDIIGENCLSLNDTTEKIYYTDAIDNTDYYEWEYPSSWTIKGDTISNSITLVPDGLSVDTIKVRAVGCSTSEWSYIAVKAAYDAPLGIEYPDCINIGIQSTFILSVIEDDSIAETIEYEWDLSTLGEVIMSYDEYNKQILVLSDGTIGDHIISVRPKNSCGENSAFVDTISLTANFSLYTYLRSAKYGRYIEIYEDEVEDAVSFAWYINGILAQNNTMMYFSFVESDETFGPYYEKGTAFVIVYYSNGCKTKMSIEWDDTTTAKAAFTIANSTSEYTLKSTNLNEINTVNDFVIFPNPAQNRITISIPEHKLDGTLCITNMSGIIYYMQHNIKSDISIDIADYESGNYIISYILNGNVSSQKIIKQ